MGEIINLRQERKRRERGAREREAGKNRIRFGLTKAEKKRNELEREHAVHHLDAHRKDEPDS